jgi:hypothetical protein
MLGGIVAVTLDGDWARSPNEPARITPMMNKDANLMKGYLNTGSAERDCDGGWNATAVFWKGRVEPGGKCQLTGDMKRGTTISE